MNFFKSFRVHVLLIVGVICCIVYGCSDQSGNINSDSVSQSTPYYEGPEGRLFTSSDAATASQISEISKMGYLNSSFAKLNEQGLVLMPQFGFIMEGSGTDSSGAHSLSVRISTLAFGRSDGNPVEAGYVNVIECELGTRISMYVVRFAATTESDFEEIVPGRIWAKYYSDVTVERDRSETDNVAGWDWKSWGKCTLTGTLAGCAGGAVDCAITGPGWAECTAGICAGSAVASGVGCALSQWFN